MAPVDPNITVFKIIFEIISAFGAVGLTLGYPSVASSFATVLSPASKTILVITMLMGRHRGLLASMKDQEEIERSAADLLRRRREEIIYEYEEKNSHTDPVIETSFEEINVRF
jgi:Trk-type K+ transport system membrane component